MFNEFYRYLNWSGRRYRVNQYGETFDVNGNLLPTSVEAEQVIIELEWVLGKRTYPAALIVLVAYGKLSLPDHLLEHVEPLYCDGCFTNLTPANLIYRFKNGPLEVENHPGFYYIPLYTDYAINSAGVVININSQKVKSWSLTKGGGPKNQTGGYSYTRVVSDEGFSRTLFLHRALCMVFKPYDRHLLSIVVNHLDGNPRNNALGNLEWATYKENNEHAVLLGLKGNSQMPVLMKNLSTGEVLRFPSAAACGRHLGHARGETRILHRIRNASDKVFEDMLSFKFDDGQPWPELDKKMEIWRRGSGSSFACRNVFTGEILIFRGSYEGERLTGVKSATILKHARTAEDIPVGGYNFRYLEEVGAWPQHSEKHLMVYRAHPIYPPDGINVLNTETGEEAFCTSAAVAANKYRMSKSGFWNHVWTKKLFQGKYLFTVFKLRESLGLPK